LESRQDPADDKVNIGERRALVKRTLWSARQMSATFFASPQEVRKKSVNDQRRPNAVNARAQQIRGLQAIFNINRQLPILAGTDL